MSHVHMPEKIEYGKRLSVPAGCPTCSILASIMTHAIGQLQGFFWSWVTNTWLEMRFSCSARNQAAQVLAHAWRPARQRLRQTAGSAASSPAPAPEQYAALSPEQLRRKSDQPDAHTGPFPITRQTASRISLPRQGAPLRAAPPRRKSDICATVICRTSARLNYKANPDVRATLQRRPTSWPWNRIATAARRVSGPRDNPVTKVSMPRA